MKQPARFVVVTGMSGAGKSHALRHFGDDADACVGVVGSGHQQHVLVGIHLDRERDGHTGKHNRVVQRNDS